MSRQMSGGTDAAMVLVVAVPVLSAVAVPGVSVAAPGAGISLVEVSAALVLIAAPSVKAVPVAVPMAAGSLTRVSAEAVSEVSEAPAIKKAAAAPTLICGPLPRMDRTSTMSGWA